MGMFRNWAAGAALLLLLSFAGAQPTPAASGASAPEALIDAQEFFKGPDLGTIRLSPSGRWLAMTGAFGKPRAVLVVFDLQEWKMHAVAAAYSDADVESVYWVDDDTLVYDLGDGRKSDRSYHQEFSRLYSVKRDGSERRGLLNNSTHESRIFGAPRVRGNIIPTEYSLLFTPPDGSGEVIIGEWVRDDDGAFTDIIAKRLDVKSARLRSLSVGAPPHTYRYLFDRQGQPRVAMTKRKGREAIHWRGAGDTGWRKLAEHSAVNPPMIPRFLTPNGDLLVEVSGGKTGEKWLTRYDFAAGQPVAEPIVSTPGFDFSGSLITEGDRLLGVRAHTEDEIAIWFDPAMKAFQEKASARRPGHLTRILCRRCGQADMTAAVSYWSDRDPGQHWHYAAKEDQWRKISDSAKGIDPERMATTDFERIRARDGLEIPVWVTRPAGATGPRPAVVWVHEGPWQRGRFWQWTSYSQFFASRGWVVLEPEFRGSTGFGSRHYEAGFRQWGRAMQDDLTDAVAWAAKKGWIDARRVCIAGSRYGGYAALMAAVREPESFRCVAARSPITDLHEMLTGFGEGSYTADWREHHLSRLIGDPVADKEALTAASPLAQAARIRAPVLLIYDQMETTASLLQGERFRHALTEAGRPPEWVVYREETGGRYRPEDRIDFARRLEGFFSRHLD